MYERKLRVKWDLDSVCNDVPIEAIIIERYNTEKQVLRESDDDEISNDFSFSRNVVESKTVVASSDHTKEFLPSSTITDVSTLSKTDKSKQFLPSYPVAEDSTLPNSDHPKESQTPASIAVDTILSNSEIHLVSSNYLFNDAKCVTLF